MAIDKKLQIFDDEGNPVDYDILANDVKFLPDGKDLPTKLAEMEEEIGEGGYTPPQGGIPKTDLAPSVQQTLDDVANKVDKVSGKGLSTNDYTTDEKSKLGNLPTADQLTQQMNSKANSTEVIKSISVNGQTPQTPTNGNVNIQVQGGLTKEDISVETQGDGTVDINVGSGANKDTYAINLNHTHENMAKLIVCEESDLPSTLDNSTIYAITDSGETEIEKLIIRGMEFAGGGTPSTEPKIVSPIGTKIDFNGASTKTVTVRALNLIEALTIAVTGVTANLQTISVNDAANGVQLTLTKGMNFTAGTLRIYSSEVDKSWNAIDSQEYQDITAVKLTGTQWLQTDYHPNANTEFELDVKFTPNANSATANSNFYFMCCVDNAGDGKKFAMYNGVWTSSFQGQYQVMLLNESSIYNGEQMDANVQAASFTGTAADREAFIADHAKISYIKGNTNGTIQMIAGGVTKSHPTSLKSSRMDSAMKIGINKDNTKIYNTFDLTIYRIKITEGDSIVRDYVPRLNNGIPGLLDVAENGSGEFISSETQNELVIVQ